MTGLPKKLIAEATSALQLEDIALLQCRFDRGNHRPEIQEATQQDLLHIQHAMVPADQSPDKKSRLRVVITLGVQVVDESAADDKSLLFRIEADFIANYVVVDELSDEAAEAFARHNALHNVWPFWRQHVFDVVQRGRLPKLNVPLMGAVVRD